jgi:drug/metabolite transporter (DMT)-like permease
MTTKRTITVLFALYFAMNLSMWLREKTGAVGFMALAALLSIGAFGLLIYAASRERKGDKSETVPTKAAVVMFGCLGLFVAFLCYRALH